MAGSLPPLFVNRWALPAGTALVLMLSVATWAGARTVNLNPGDNIALAVAANPAGTIFRLACGRYRLSEAGGTISPLAGDKIVGAGLSRVPQFIGSGYIPCAELDGSVVLTGWVAARGLWHLDLPASEVINHPHGSCNRGIL